MHKKNDETAFLNFDRMNTKTSLHCEKVQVKDQLLEATSMSVIIYHSKTLASLGLAITIAQIFLS